MSDNKVELLLQVIENQNTRIDTLTDTVTTLFKMMENLQKGLECHQGFLEEIDVLLKKVDHKDTKSFN